MIVNFPVGRLDEQTHGTLLAARGPGCVWSYGMRGEKDRRRDRKDKFRTLYLDPLCFSLPLEADSQGHTSMASITLCFQSRSAKGRHGRWSVLVCLFFCLPGPLMSVPSSAGHKCYHLWVLRILSFRENGGMLVSQGRCNKILQTGRLKKTQFIVS